MKIIEKLTDIEKKILGINFKVKSGYMNLNIFSRLCLKDGVEKQIDCDVCEKYPVNDFTKDCFAYNE